LNDPLAGLQQRRAGVCPNLQLAGVLEECRQGDRLLLQDAWSMNRLTLNIGGRWDKYVGTLPDQSTPGGRFSGARTVPGKEAINHSIACGASARRTI
jgi:hypothetical protein